MKFVECGLFKMPGVAFDRDELPDDLLDEMKDWIEQTQIGMVMTDRLFSFMEEGHRDFFALRWSDRLPKKED
jgi:hypothetical protein